MKQLIFLPFCLLILASKLLAQESYKDLYNISASVGITDLGAIYKLGFTTALSEKIGIKAEGYVDVSSKRLVRMINTGLDIKGQYYVGSLGDFTNFFVALGGTVSTVNDNNFNKPKENQSTSKLMYGIVGEAEVEFNITQEFKISITGNQRYLLSGIYGRKWYDISLGMKFYLFKQ